MEKNDNFEFDDLNPSSSNGPPDDGCTGTVDSPDIGIDLDSIRLSQGYAEMGVEKVLLHVPVRKPNRSEFVRVNPDPMWTIDVAVIDDKDERTVYLVSSSLISELPGEVSARRIVTAQNRQGVTFFWPLRIPGEDGREDAWMISHLTAAELAETSWVRIKANMSLGAYEVHRAAGELSDPEWPHEGFQRLLSLAFRDTYIDSPDHPVLRRLRGEI